MDSLRIVLVIIGVVIILGLLGHGLWTIRKNNQVAKDKREQLERKRRRTPDDLFSQADEVDADALHDPLNPRPPRSKKTVQVVQASTEEQSQQSSRVSSQEPQMHATVEPDLFAGHDPDMTIEQMEIDLNEDDFASRQQMKDSARLDDIADAQPGLMDDEGPRVMSADESAIMATDEVQAQHAASDEGAFRDGERPEPYLGDDFGDSDEFSDEFDRMTTAQSDAPTHTKAQDSLPAQEQLEVITLFVTGDIQGAILLQMTTELGLKYGDMDIFHRHAETSGHGPVLFSVANMFNPGTFDIHNMERFETQGIVLFMTLPLKSDGHQAFTMMYNAANKIADAMPRAAVLDGNRNPVTKQSVQHTYQKIREFERKQRLQKPTTQW